MRIFGLDIRRTKAAPANLLPLESRGSWWPVIRESYTGAWQSNVEVTITDVLTHPTVFACVTLISTDVAKQRLRLVETDGNGIWTETENSAYSPVLRNPNSYQTQFQFFKQWVLSKLIHGNTYVLLERDNRGGLSRGNVIEMHVLDPNRVTPLVSPNGSVYYDLKRDDLSNQPQDQIIVPAIDIIHDRMEPLYHPLVGKSPLVASGVAAMLGLRILDNSATFFANGSRPGGVLMVPGAITNETAQRLKDTLDSNYSGANYGKWAVLGDGMEFKTIDPVVANDSQLTEQWSKVSEAIASAFHVPYHLVGGPPPPYNNIQALTVQYLTQCLHGVITPMEQLLDRALGMPKDLGVEFDKDDLLWMDSQTMMSTIAEGVKSGVLAPNEGRAKLNLKPVEGGDTPYLQQQNFSLAALDEREDAAEMTPPALQPAPAEPPTEPEAKEWDDEFLEALSFGLATKQIEQVRAA